MVVKLTKAVLTTHHVARVSGYRFRFVRVDRAPIYNLYKNILYFINHSSLFYSQNALDPWTTLIIPMADNISIEWQALHLKCLDHKGEPPVALPPAEAPVVLNCDHGDPTMFEAFWSEHKDAHVTVSCANDTLSYFVKSKKQDGGPWFVSADLDDAVRELHACVGNAVTDGRTIVVGTGSTQLFQAALYAVAIRDRSTSTAVVAESPFYSAYPQIIDYLQSKLFHWAGDATTYKAKGDETFIEMVTTPNNPCGEMRDGVVKGGNGVVVHDLAYYWPTYTPITSAFAHDVMLFTLSKCTGHAGLRIGWAVVKDPEVAKKMADFIVWNTIGLSQDAQHRAAGLMRAVVRGYEGVTQADSVADGMCRLLGHKWFFIWGKRVADCFLAQKRLFHWGNAVMESRWGRVRFALAGNKYFKVPELSAPANCTFLGTKFSTFSAFIWLKCEIAEADCQKILLSNGILSRGGAHFGVSPQYARLSLLDREPAVDLLVNRLARLKCTTRMV